MDNRKISESRKYWIEFVVAGIGATIAVIGTVASGDAWTLKSTLLVGLSVTAALSAGILIRIRMHVDSQTKQIAQLIDGQTSHLSRLIADLSKIDKKLAASYDHLRETFGLFSIFVERLSKANSEDIDKLVKDVIERRYTIDTAIAVYRHDTSEIEKLEENDQYRATHPFTTKTDVLKSRPLSISAAFDRYIKAQCEARKRGVCVKRIYIVDKLEIPNEPSKQQHLRYLYEAGIDVRLIASEKLDPKFSRDFVLVGSKMLGIGVSPQGFMEGAIMLMNNAGVLRSEYSSYSSYFDELHDASTKLEDLYPQVKGGSQVSNESE